MREIPPNLELICKISGTLARSAIAPLALPTQIGTGGEGGHYVKFWGRLGLSVKSTTSNFGRQSGALSNSQDRSRTGPGVYRLKEKLPRARGLAGHAAGVVAACWRLHDQPFSSYSRQVFGP